MNRLFSIIRRRPNYVDLVTPFNYNADGYRLKWASNFDGTFTTMFTSSNVGFVDGTINPYVIDAQPMGGSTGLAGSGRNIRMVFNPATYSIPDTSSFWLQFVQTVGGVEQTPGAPTLVLPDSALKGQGIVTIQGNAPLGAASANSLQLDLPFLMQNLQITNNAASAGATLFVSTEAGGPEVAIGPGLGFYGYATIYGAQPSIWVRGSAQVSFSATFTLAFPR